MPRLLVPYLLLFVSLSVQTMVMHILLNSSAPALSSWFWSLSATYVCVAGVLIVQFVFDYHEESRMFLLVRFVSTIILPIVTAALVGFELSNLLEGYRRELNIHTVILCAAAFFCLGRALYLPFSVRQRTQGDGAEVEVRTTQSIVDFFNRGKHEEE